MVPASALSALADNLGQEGRDQNIPTVVLKMEGAWTLLSIDE